MNEENRANKEGEDLQPTDPAIVAAMSLDGDPVALRRYYDDWANAYDADVGAEGYALPDTMARLLAEVVALDRGEPIDGLTIDPAPPAPVILDVGCGTGLIGLRLAVDGYTTIDGVDLSPAMIDLARDRGCYRTVRGEVDITQPPAADMVGAYDIVTVGGVFTLGHVPPSTLGPVSSMVRPGGLLLVTTRAQYYDESGYGSEARRLEQEGRLTLVHAIESAPYTLDSHGHYWAYLVTG